MKGYIFGPRGQFREPDLEERIKRLEIAVSLLATAIDEEGTTSMEGVIEKTLFPEHF